MRHIINSSDLTKADYDAIFDRLNHFTQKGISPDIAQGKIGATFFFQPSTRTMNFIQSGMIRMGGGWIGIMGEKGISMEKGESFDDTIREYSCFADFIGIRHPDDDSAVRAAKVSYVPILNCQI